MRRIQAIMATTHVDRHNERVSLAALESMREQIRNSILPCDVNHDPRFAPFGRVIDAEITHLPDGEHALEGEIGSLKAVHYHRCERIGQCISERCLGILLSSRLIVPSVDRSFKTPWA